MAPQNFSDVEEASRLVTPPQENTDHFVRRSIRKQVYTPEREVHPVTKPHDMRRSIFRNLRKKSSVAVATLHEDDDMLESITLAQVLPCMVKYGATKTVRASTGKHVCTPFVAPEEDTEMLESTAATSPSSQFEFLGAINGYIGESSEALVSIKLQDTTANSAADGMVSTSIAKNKLLRGTSQKQGSSTSTLMVRHETTDYIKSSDSNNTREVVRDHSEGVNGDYQMDMDIDDKSDTTIAAVETKTDTMCVGAGLNAFAESLANLSNLLDIAVEHLHPNAVRRLENEIAHGWKIDEMSDYVTAVLEYEKEIKASVMRK